MTSTMKSKLNFSYSGGAIWWYGYYALDMPSTTSKTTYAIDGGSPVSLSTYAPSIAPGAGSQQNATLNQIMLFHTPLDTEYGIHSVQAVHYGDHTTTSLTLQYMIIQGLPVPAPPLPSANSSSSRLHRGVIAGGLMGSSFLLLILATLPMYRRWTKKKQAKELEGARPHPEPFGADAAGLPPRKTKTSQQDTSTPFMQEMEAPPQTKWTRSLTNDVQPASNFVTVRRADTGGGSVTRLIPSSDFSADMAERRHPPLDPRSAPQMTIYTTPLGGLFPPQVLPIPTIQEDDSGMRLLDAHHHSTDAAVQVLPPAYTAH
ncbi:hypothetical protein D9619_007610 [Psilocybe cf. subviscida]|uniref:Uncharacterized protein n=1 Tax=Psilocybe cf. subviscida TaxID=2480587 RepID=A0A8H5B1S0_9AGAR|nr:hypothetical protein D9619_007610 [Psilocybe cf. subviscida]